MRKNLGIPEEDIDEFARKNASKNVLFCDVIVHRVSVKLSLQFSRG